MAKRLFFTAYGISIFGTGLVYPLTAIFLRETVHLSAMQVAAYFALAALSGVLVNPAAGMWCDRQGPYRVAIMAVAAQTMGPVTLALAHSPAVVWAAAVLTGVGSGAFFAVQTPLIASLFGKSSIGSVYSRQYVIMNVATAVAGLLSGWAVGTWGESAYRIAFVYNGISFLIYGVLAVGLIGARLGYPRLVDEEAPDDEPASTASPWRPYTDRRFLPLLGMQLAISAFAFAQMDAVLPVVFREVGGLPVLAVSAFLTVNGVTVVLLQPTIGRLCERLGHIRSLRLLFLTWGVSFALGALSMVGGLPVAARIALVLLFAVVFAVGECFLSPSFQPLVADRSPARSLGSYSASVSLVYSLGLALGPAVMLPVFSQWAVYWGILLLAMGCGLVALRMLGSESSTDASLQSQVMSR
ncbi:MFS transporter [Streptomyces bacillaris]|uniref:MFS transporter n=1 Tax=Streptomyces bacillaris TaxID=68179 RepID=UPI00335932A6